MKKNIVYLILIIIISIYPVSYSFVNNINNLINNGFTINILNDLYLIFLFIIVIFFLILSNFKISRKLLFKFYSIIFIFYNIIFYITMIYLTKNNIYILIYYSIIFVLTNILFFIFNLNYIKIISIFNKYVFDKDKINFIIILISFFNLLFIQYFSSEVYKQLISTYFIYIFLIYYIKLMVINKRYIIKLKNTNFINFLFYLLLILILLYFNYFNIKKILYYDFNSAIKEIYSTKLFISKDYYLKLNYFFLFAFYEEIQKAFIIEVLDKINFKKWFIILFTTLFFIITHNRYFHNNGFLISILTNFSLLSFVLVYAYYKTRNFYLTTFLHAIGNILITIIGYY